MDEIGQRLKETSDACITAYEKWLGAKKESAALESLQEAVHELRKVSARLEIEMAVSEREEMSQRPIPVPTHRTSRRRDNNDSLPDFIAEGNGDSDGPKRGRSGARRSSGGGRGRSPQKPQSDDSGNS